MSQALPAPAISFPSLRQDVALIALVSLAHSISARASALRCLPPHQRPTRPAHTLSASATAETPTV